MRTHLPVVCVVLSLGLLLFLAPEPGESVWHVYDGDGVITQYVGESDDFIHSLSDRSAVPSWEIPRPSRFRYVRGKLRQRVWQDVSSRARAAAFAGEMRGFRRRLALLRAKAAFAASEYRKSLLVSIGKISYNISKSNEERMNLGVR